MTQASQASEKQTRNRDFGRVYDHEAGTAEFVAAFDANYKYRIDLSKYPDNVIRGFALKAIADHIVGEANDALKDESNGDEAARREAAKQALAEADKELLEGNIDFRAGVGLGGMRSAIGALGSVLFELGKTFVVNAHGEKLSFSDVHGARAVVKSLYLDTDEVTKPDPRGGKDKDGNPRTIKVTSRQIFNAIQAMPQIKQALEAKRKAKPVKDFGDVLG